LRTVGLVADDAEPVFFPSWREWRAWLEEHHQVATQVLVGFRKKGSGMASFTWSESVDQALCFGWIDGVRRAYAPDAYTIRFTPRRPGSSWSAVNLAKVEQLTTAGLMTPAGVAAFERRDPVRTRTASYEREHPAELTDAEQALFQENEQAWQWFHSQPPGYRRTAVHWVDSAKRPQTRATRLSSLIACCAEGSRIPPLRR
jgi:uncharacterized protein YdeI (YjbR/CyaY-like superfamily)